MTDLHDHHEGPVDDTTNASTSNEVSGSEIHNMYFYISQYVTVLFKGWQTMNWQEMLASCIGVVLIAILYEGFNVLWAALNQREVAASAALSHKSSAHKAASDYSSTSLNQPVVAAVDKLEMEEEQSPLKTSPGMRHPLLRPSYILLTFVHMFHVLLGLCVMLIFMTFNFYICLSVIVGTGIGFYCFSWLVRQSASDGTSASCALTH